MTTGPDAEDPPDPSDDGATVWSGNPRGNNGAFQRRLASRLFPGPSESMSNRRAQHIEALLRSPDGFTSPGTRSRGTSTSNPSRGGDPRRLPTTAVEPAPAAPAPLDTAQLEKALDEQSELLRAILATSVDSLTDARATAQNSRTFAWAGAAIAFLTLIATVVSIVTAVSDH